VSGWQMLAATGIAMPYVFVSRAMFPGAEKETERSLEDHYLRHRVLILLILVIPPVVSLISKIILDQVRDRGWDLEWIIARTLLPLLLLPLRNRTAQRAGLGAFVVLELVGLFRT
jgi:hypothetical protein